MRVTSIIPALSRDPWLTDAHGCECLQDAGGVSRDAGDAQVGEVNPPDLVLVVVQDAETAGGPGGERALKGQKRVFCAEREKARDRWRWMKYDNAPVWQIRACLFLPFTEQEVAIRPDGDILLRLGLTADLAAGRLFVAEQVGFLRRI